MNPYLTHLLPVDPDRRFGVEPAAEEWDDYLLALDELERTFPSMRGAVDRAAATARARKARLEGNLREVRRLPVLLPEGDPKLDPRPPPAAAPPPPPPQLKPAS